MLNSIDPVLKMSDAELTDYLTETHRGEINDRFRKLVMNNKNLKLTIDYLNGQKVRKERTEYMVDVRKKYITYEKSSNVKDVSLPNYNPPKPPTKQR